MTIESGGDRGTGAERSVGVDSANRPKSPGGGGRRLVVVVPNWLGDAVMCLPAIADLRRASAGAVIDVAARPSIAPLFGLVDGVTDVIVVKDSATAARELRDRCYDAALLLPNSFNSAMLARRAGIRERWGYRADFRGPLLTRPIARLEGVHQAEYYQHLVRALGFPSGSREPRLDVPEALRQRGQDLLSAEGWDGRSPLVAIAPGAAYGGAKRWPAESFAAVASGLGADGVRTVLIGASADAPAAAEVCSAIDSGNRPIDLVGRTDLPTLASVLVRCRALVTNDSGAMHFAAALGVNVTAMFGPTDERATRPLGRGRHVVLTHDVWCRPCMLRECPLAHRCMRGISVSVVIEAARSSL
jgi:heptosyltransferase-2